MAENNWELPRRSTSWEAPTVGPITEHATIGPSIVIKGELSGQEALFVDGTVEGSIHFPDPRVTIGRRSKVRADIKAHDIVVMGSVNGNIQCSDLLDVRAESTIQGEIVTRRIRIDDGAVLKGSVEIEAHAKSVKEPDLVKPVPAMAEPVTPAPVLAPAPDPEPARPTLAAAAAASSAKRVAGSSVLWKPTR
jgi:cytoskeletal protein CcmA (bactofilin family)